MRTLLALVLVAAASAVVDRRPDIEVTTATKEKAAALPPYKQMTKYRPQPWHQEAFLWPNYGYETPQDIDQAHKRIPGIDWINQEIKRLSRIQMVPGPSMQRTLREIEHRWPKVSARRGRNPYYTRAPQWPGNQAARNMLRDSENKGKQSVPGIRNNDAKEKMFASTPRERIYYFTTSNNFSGKTTPSSKRAGKMMTPGIRAPLVHDNKRVPLPLREIRQNPNYGRHNTKSLVAGDLEELRLGLGPALDDKTRHHNGLEGNNKGAATNTFYGVVVFTAIGVAAVLALVGFIVGWYTLAKRAKAAADVDYPAYGVTGPTVDPTGDRNLAHSAQIFHYQHQKQQIMALERSGMEQRSGSFSDPESEDENEEGDYTVYECPGFATTGDMEVKNPLFNEEPTPATPPKCDAMKPPKH